MTLSSDTNRHSRNITMQDIADAVGISKTAVSQALTGRGRISSARRQMILEAAQRLGYEPDLQARRLSKGRFDKLISLFALHIGLGTGNIKSSLINHMLREHGFDVTLHAIDFSEPLPSQEEVDDLMRYVCRNKPRAIICNSRYLLPSTIKLLQEFQQMGGVVVGYDFPVDLECDQVIFDRAANARQAAKHLIAMGHRNISINMDHLYPTDGRFITARFKAFAHVLKNAGLEMQKHHLFYSNRIYETYEEAGWDIAEQFLALPTEQRPSALFTVNDYIAAAFVHAVMRAGLNVPEDISVVSDDDLPAARACIVPLTAVTQPVRQIAEAVVELLIHRLENPSTPFCRRTIKGQLNIRQSVAKIST